MSYYDDNEFDYDSDEWKMERDEYLSTWNGDCEKCYHPTLSPHVHHKYGTNVKIYEALCPKCHSEHHNDHEDSEEIRCTRSDYFYGKCDSCDSDIVMKKTWDGKWNKCEEYEISDDIEEIEKYEGIIRFSHICNFSKLKAGIEQLKILNSKKKICKQCGKEVKNYCGSMHICNDCANREYYLSLPPRGLFAFAT